MRSLLYVSAAGHRSTLCQGAAPPVAALGLLLHALPAGHKHGGVLPVLHRQLLGRDAQACDQHHAGHGGATGPDAALPAHPHPRHEAPAGRTEPGALLGGAGRVHDERLARGVRLHPRCRTASLGGHRDLRLCGRAALQPATGGLLLDRRALVAQVDLAVAALLPGTGRNVVCRHQGRQQRHSRRLQHGVLGHLCPAVLLCVPPGRHARGPRPRRGRALDRHTCSQAGGRAAGQLPLCPGPARHL